MKLDESNHAPKRKAPRSWALTAALSVTSCSVIPPAAMSAAINPVSLVWEHRNMPRKPRPLEPGEPEPEQTVEVTARIEVTIDGKSVDEFFEDADNFFDKMASMTTKVDDESLAARIRASIA